MRTCMAWALLAVSAVPMAHARESASSSAVDYDTRVAAEARARELRGPKQRVEVVKGSRQVSVHRLELGYYGEFELARIVQHALQTQGITPAVIRRTTSGYAVSVGEFDRKRALKQQSDRLHALGYRNLHTITTVESRDVYHVVVTALPGHAQRGGEASRPSAQDAQKSKRFVYVSRAQAERKAAQLQQQGYATTTHKESSVLHVKTLMLRVYPQWSDAKRTAARLQKNGIPTRVVNDPIERGYAVNAGAFRDQRNLRARYQKIRKIGYKSISIIPIEVTVTRYVINATALPTQQAATPPAAVAEAPAPATTSMESGDESQVMVFGGTAEALPSYQSALDSSSSDQAMGFRAKVDQLWVEAGQLTDRSQGVDGSYYVNGAASARWRPSQHWEYRVAARVDGYLQTGTPNYSDGKLDYGDTYVRYRGTNVRLTAGAQTVIWGRVDGIPPTDRLSVQDISRFSLDDLQDRRRAVPALRLESFRQGYKFDALWVPDFRPAELANRDSIWYPVDRQRGQFVGLPYSSLVAPMIKGGTVGEDDGGQGGYGVRMSRTGSGLDYALTVQRARQSLPYYEMNDAARRTLLATGSATAALAAANGDTFVARHPWTTVVGGDLGFEAAGATWRMELAYLSAAPATTTDLRLISVKGVDWVAGVEFYPGDANARVNLQLAGHHLLNTPNIIDRKNIYSFNGSLENVFAYNRWRAKLRFSIGLDKRDVYLNPELAYLGWEPHEVYLGMHYFDGADGTIGGFHKDHSMIVVGWRAHF